MSSNTRTSLVGLLALASLAACTGAKVPPPALGRASTEKAAEVATFEGRFDPATGALTITTTPAGAASGRVGRSVYQPFQDGSPGTGPVDTFELVTEATPAPGFNAAGCGGVGSFDGRITLRSFFTAQAFSSVYVELTSVTGGHEACNSAAATDGMSAASGLWNYGAIAAGGNNFQDWSFRFAASERFIFRGRIMAQAAALAAPPNGNVASSFEWTPSMFMDPPHSFKDVGTTLSHVKWNGTSFVDSKSVLTFTPSGGPTSLSVGLTYPPQAYATGFSGADYFTADGGAINTSGNFTVCAKFKPGANPGLGVFRSIVAKGDPVNEATGTGWALAHFGPLVNGDEPEYSFMYRAAAGGPFVRSIYGPQNLPADPNDRAYEYVCGGRNADTVQVDAFGQMTGTSYAVTGTFPSPASLPIVIGAAAGGANPYVDGGVYEVIFDSRAATPAVMNEIVAAAEGRSTYNGAAFVGSAARVPGIVGADGATYVLPQGSTAPLSTDASGLLDAGKVLAFGGTTAGFGPVLAGSPGSYCVGAEVASANWAAADGCVLGDVDGILKLFIQGGTMLGVNGTAFAGSGVDVTGFAANSRHKFVVCATPHPGAGNVTLYVDGSFTPAATLSSQQALLDITASQLEVGDCGFTFVPALTAARVGRVFACPSADPTACN